jgi:hypothetical protein
MNLYIVILGSTFVTLVVTIIAAIKFPSWSYRLIGLVALCAFLFAVHQFMTRQYHPGALLFSAVSAGLITVRVLANFWRSHRR